MLKTFLKFWKNTSSFKRTKMVLVVRSDLRMTQGKIASQCAHAAIILFITAQKSAFRNSLLNSWMISGQPKVVLQVDSENSLKKLYSEAQKNNLNATVVHDAGKTQVASGTATVLGIGPNAVEDIDKITKKLKLL